MSVAGKRPSGSVPVLGRSLTLQAADVAIGVAAFARASLEAHRAYLEAESPFPRRRPQAALWRLQAAFTARATQRPP